MHNKSLALTAFALAFAVSTSADAAAAKPTPPKPWLETVVDRAAGLAKRKVEPDTPAEEKWQAEAKSVIDDMLDWKTMTEKALGRNWKKRTPEEQKEFASLLREMIEASYRSKLRMAARGNVKKPATIVIDWLEEKVRKDKAKVAAKVKGEDKVAILEFSLLWTGDRWRVYDLAIDDVSTVRTYRSQFGKLIADEGFDALLERMRNKIEDIRAGRGDLAP